MNMTTQKPCASCDVKHNVDFSPCANENQASFFMRFVFTPMIVLAMLPVVALGTLAVILYEYSVA